MFAAHVLSGILPAPKLPGVLPLNPESAAKIAYSYADAMLRVRLMSAEELAERR